MVYPYRYRTSDKLVKEIMEKLKKEKNVSLNAYSSSVSKKISKDLHPIRKDIHFVRDPLTGDKFLLKENPINMLIKPSYKTKKNSLDIIFSKF